MPGEWCLITDYINRVKSSVSWMAYYLFGQALFYAQQLVLATGTLVPFIVALVCSLDLHMYLLLLSFPSFVLVAGACVIELLVPLPVLFTSELCT